VWDLRVWGHAGRLSFAGGLTVHPSRGERGRPVAQDWLKEATKACAVDALVCENPASARGMVTAVGLFSEHLGRRTDRGEDPGALGRKDVEAFLARLGHLEAAGTMSSDRRVRTVRTLGQFLRDCRAIGLTEPGEAMGGLGEDVTVRRKDVPAQREPDPEDAGSALPEVVLAQLLDEQNLARLEALSGPGVRAALELQAGVGRRTGELCSLALDCLDQDERLGEDGARRQAAVLVHDMPKVAKVGCRLPINEREAAIIGAQQARVRAKFPDADPGRLVLFPRPTKNPDGTRPVAPAQFQRAIQVWVRSLPRLDGPGTAGAPVPFPRQRVFPYAFRHTFAQRHADAGTPVDTLKELLGHQRIHTTLGYYRVTAKRKRDAQDRLGPLQIDAGGHRVRPDLSALTDTEAARDQIGQVAVPFGTCTEPTNVAAGGHSCPFRHRCTGCTYFRTDPSYTPELRGYLAQLLADRERLATAVPALAEWARRDAAPSDAEIDAVRRLLRANDEVLAGIGDDDRTALEAAITTIRTQRAQLAVSFPPELAGVVHQNAPVFFPTIERADRAQAHHG
jgi:integrase